MYPEGDTCKEGVGEEGQEIYAKLSVTHESQLPPAYVEQTKQQQSTKLDPTS